MTLKEFYGIEGNYDSIIKRMRSEERIMKFLRMFLADNNYGDLRVALNSGDAATAFRAVHTLKGLCLNLGFDRLLASASALTESLRDGEIKEEAMDLFVEVSRDYEVLVNSFKQVEA